MPLAPRLVNTQLRGALRMTEKIFEARRDLSVDSTHTRSAQNE
jgi:hypothetical protein